MVENSTAANPFLSQKAYDPQTGERQMAIGRQL